MLKRKRADLGSFNVRKKYILTFMIFIFFFAIYLVFLTNDHFAVDGATRALEVFWKKEVVLHGNNHILYPFNVYLWSKGTSLLLGEANNSFTFIKRIQVMNALFSAIVLTLTYLIYLRFLKKEYISLLLVFVFGISNAFFSHAISSAEPIIGFLFFVISFYLIVHFSDKGPKRSIAFAISAFIFAYSIMSYLAMAFGLPLLLAYIFYKTNGKKAVAGYFIIFFILLGILFVISAYYKGLALSDIDEALSGNKFADRSHTGFKLKNIPQYPFGMINAFFHINAKYDLPTYILSLKNMNVNSLFSVVFGLILGITLLIIIFQSNIFRSFKGSLMKRELSLLTVSLIYFLSASVAIIGFMPVYDKLWIMGLHSFLLLGGIVYTNAKKTKLLKILFFTAISIIIIFNFGFAIKSKIVPSDIICPKNSLKFMKDKYILLGTWGGSYGKYFSTFYYNNASKYYSIPNLAINNGLDTKKVISFLKNEFCNEKIPFYVVSDVLIDEYKWNTFLGDEMRMGYILFHKELLDHIDKVTECVYEVDTGIC